MPKAPAIASDKEVSDFLKSSRSSAGPPPSASPGKAETTPSEPGELGYGEQISRGARKSVASLGVNLARLGNEALGYSAPGLSRKLSDLAAQSSTAQRLQKFADEPYQSFAEGVGGVGTDIASFAVQPELGIERGLLALAGRYGPAAAKWVKIGEAGEKGTEAGKFVPTTFGKVSKAGAQIAEGAGKGAVGGAITDPDDPETGAIAGAVGGGAVPALSGPAGRAIMGTVGSRAPHAGLAALATFLNVPYHHLVNYGLGVHGLLHGVHYGREAGYWLFDKLGRKIAYIPPGGAGAIASQAATGAGLSSTGLPWPGSATPTAPNYGFDETEENNGQNSQAGAQ